MSGLLKGAFPDQEAQLQSAVSTLQSNETSQGVTQFANTVSNILSSINQSQLQQELLSNVLDVTGLVLVDTVAMATYSVSPMEEIPLTVGVNIKMVNRRIAAADSYSLSAQNLSDFTNVTNYVKNDIDQSTTRWGADLGFLYDFEEYNLSVGSECSGIWSIPPGNPYSKARSPVSSQYRPSAHGGGFRRLLASDTFLEYQRRHG